MKCSWEAAFLTVPVLFWEVEPFDFFPCLKEISGAETDAVADVEGGGGVSGDYFYQYAPVSLVVEEDVVALALAAEVVHEVVHTYLDEVCQSIGLFSFQGQVCLQVDFPEAYAGILGDSHSDPIFLRYPWAGEEFRHPQGTGVKFGEAYQLHVGVADGAP